MGHVVSAQQELIASSRQSFTAGNEILLYQGFSMLRSGNIYINIIHAWTSSDKLFESLLSTELLSKYLSKFKVA